MHKYVKYYDGSWKSELSQSPIKTQSHALEVNARTYRWNEGNCKECTCRMCNTNEVGTALNVLSIKARGMC